MRGFGRWAGIGYDASVMPSARKAHSEQMDREIAHVLATSKGGTLHYHPIGKDGERWPAWLHAFEHACGVYSIRDKASGSVLYVGSSKNRLYDTITRHFQQWGRKKKFWKGYKSGRGAGHDPGMTYSRSRCEVAVRVVSCGEQLDEEGRTIQRLKPRDNLVMDPSGELEDAPF